MLRTNQQEKVISDGVNGLSALLPHRPPMVLLDGVESFDDAGRSLVAFVKITPDSPFFVLGSGVPSWVAIEYMAQAAAALVGRFDQLTVPDAPPRPGFLLGTRKLLLDLEHFEEGATYRIFAGEIFSDGAAAAFECRISDSSGKVVASASLNAFRPQDLSEFIKQQNSLKPNT